MKDRFQIILILSLFGLLLFFTFVPCVAADEPGKPELQPDERPALLTFPEAQEWTTYVNQKQENRLEETEVFGHRLITRPPREDLSYLRGIQIPRSAFEGEAVQEGVMGQAPLAPTLYPLKVRSPDDRKGHTGT